MDAINLTTRLLPATGDVERLSAECRRERAAFPVALVSMPWARPDPQLAVGLLTAIGRSHGFPVDSYHLGLDLTPVVPLAGQVEVQSERAAAEWLFGVAAFGAESDPGHELLGSVNPSELAKLAAAGLPRERLEQLRDAELPAWIERMAAARDWGRYRVVGFSSSFAQNTASFALAARIKDTWPHVTILLGGPNMERPMGEAWLRGVPAVDLVVCGEADQVFPTLLVALCGGRDPGRIPGVLAKRPDGEIRDGGTIPPFDALDTLPVPDYRGFYDQLRQLGLSPRQLPPSKGLWFEASRGCWWGERSHCTFCGLNGTTMAYRTKSPRRVLDELDELARRHGSRRFAATDNILGREHVAGVLDELARRGAPYDLFFEVKSNLARDQLRRLRRAGVWAFQPGIESLHSRVLGLMKKGVRASTNLNLLRWAAHYRIRAVWSLLWGFPGEQVDDVLEQASLLPDLVHLPHPYGAGRIHIDRYSPIYQDRDTLPIHGLRPANWYRLTFPATIDLDRAAFMFDGRIEGALPDEAYRPLEAAHDAWVARWSRSPAPSLSVRFFTDAAEVRDTRGERERLLVLDAAATAAYRACFDGPAKASTVFAAAEAVAGPNLAREAVARLDADRLVMRDGNLLVALALPEVRPRRLRPAAARQSEPMAVRA